MILLAGHTRSFVVYFEFYFFRSMLTKLRAFQDNLSSSQDVQEVIGETVHIWLIITVVLSIRILETHEPAYGENFSVYQSPA